MGLDHSWGHMCGPVFVSHWNLDRSAFSLGASVFCLVGGKEETMTRIKGNETIKGVVAKMAEGNPGAITVMMGILREEKGMGPLGPLGVLLDLDTLGLYGSDIWILYKDLCGENLVLMLGVMRAYQMGLVSAEVIRTSVKSGKVGWGKV